MNVRRFTISAILLAVFILLGFFALQSAEAAVSWHPGQQKCIVFNGVNSCQRVTTPPAKTFRPIAVTPHRNRGFAWQH